MTLNGTMDFSASCGKDTSLPKTLGKLGGDDVDGDDWLVKLWVGSWQQSIIVVMFCLSLGGCVTRCDTVWKGVRKWR